MTFSVMPFGKGKGTPLTQMDGSYIEWALANLELKGPLRGALEAEMQRRADGGEGDEAPPPASDGGPVTGDARIRQIVQQELASLFRRAAATMEKSSSKP